MTTAQTAYTVTTDRSLSCGCVHSPAFNSVPDGTYISSQLETEIATWAAEQLRCSVGSVHVDPRTYEHTIGFWADL